MKFDVWGVFKNLSKIPVTLKSEKNKAYCTWRPMYIFIISRSFPPIMRNVSGKSSRENQNTNFVFSNFFRKSCPIRDNLKNIYCRVGQATDDEMAHAHCMWWTIKTTQTLTVCNIYYFSTATKWHRRAWMLHCLPRYFSTLYSCWSLKKACQHSNSYSIDNLSCLSYSYLYKFCHPTTVTGFTLLTIKLESHLFFFDAVYRWERLCWSRYNVFTTDKRNRMNQKKMSVDSCIGFKSSLLHCFDGRI
jgi:hypothetical protein